MIIFIRQEEEAPVRLVSPLTEDKAVLQTDTQVAEEVTLRLFSLKHCSFEANVTCRISTYYNVIVIVLIIHSSATADQPQAPTTLKDSTERTGCI